MAEPWRNPQDDRGGFWTSTEGICFECEGPTRRVDICFEASLHYTCAPEADRKYWEAVVLGDGWNYRMFHRTLPEGEEFTIREAYYTNDEVTSWSAEPIALSGETKLELMNDVGLMATAVQRPVIELTPDGNGFADAS